MQKFMICTAMFMLFVGMYGMTTSTIDIFQEKKEDKVIMEKYSGEDIRKIERNKGEIFVIMLDGSSRIVEVNDGEIKEIKNGKQK